MFIRHLGTPIIAHALRPGNPEVGRLGLPWTAHPLKDRVQSWSTQIQLWDVHIPLPSHWAD